MEENNQFNISNENTFKQSKPKKQKSGFGKTVIVPFVSGIAGATLVIGTCVGVPAVKNKVFSTTNIQTISQDTKQAVDLSEYSKTSVAVANKVLPSVVGISIKYQISSFFGTSETEGSGSGIIISDDGYILTNNHVISADNSSNFYAITEAKGITVKLYNDSESYEATVVGSDSYTDLAVLKIDKEGLTPAVLGNSDNLQVGEFVMAIGNPLGMDYSVTSGIVSALNREIAADGTSYYAIQTDAAINSGNSGGALVNANGEVIGINTLKMSGSGIEGMGFAIPISSTTNVVDQLITYNTVKRPYIGIGTSAVTEALSKRYNIPVGIYVESIEEGGAGEKANLQVGDIITEIDGTKVATTNELNKVKYTKNIGDKITLKIYRNNEYIDVEVTLVEEPEKTEQKQQAKQQTTQPDSNYYYFGDGSGSLFDFFR